jgi:predicted peptidase
LPFETPPLHHCIELGIDIHRVRSPFVAGDLRNEKPQYETQNSERHLALSTHDLWRSQSIADKTSIAHKHNDNISNGHPMNRFLVALSFMVVPTLLSAQEKLGEFEVHSIQFTGGKYTKETFKYLVLPPAKVEADKKYPLVLFLHGAGERGSNPAKNLRMHFPAHMAKAEQRAKFPCYLVVPQCRNGAMWIDAHWSKRESSPLTNKPNDQLAMAIAVLEKSMKTLPVDKQRVYLTGLSMGGFGSWELAMRRPELFAALAPVCGGGDERQAAKIKNIPIWTAHGDADGAVWVGRTRQLVESVKKSGGNIKYTEYKGVGHNSWTPFYTDKNEVVSWMFEQRKK